MKRVHGIGASRGIAIGPAIVHHAELPSIHARPVADVEAEGRRLRDAIAAVMRGLEDLEATATMETGAEIGEIFEAHRMFLEDPSFSGAALDVVESQAVCAEAAVDQTVAGLAEEFEAIGDEYFAARAVDLRDIGTQVIRELLGLGRSGLSHLTEPVVIVAHDLTPSETVTIPSGMALAFVTEIGSPTSHTAILARSLGIPAVVGIGGFGVSPDASLAVDGEAGTVWVDPDAVTVVALQRRKADDAARMAQAAVHADEPAITRDGTRVEVVANIGNPDDAQRADAAGAEGVGLFRTEFLFIDQGAAPTEDEQYDAYRAVFDIFGDRPVVVRTLDVGGDKDVPGIELDSELNPFLGKRGIRLTLDADELFRTQLRALIRAGAGASLKLMFPMVASLAEVHAARDVVSSVIAELDEAGTTHASTFEIGIMIEVPSAAVMADLLAPHVDFFSIGTNDLTQYTLAADRTNPAVAAMADALHPAVLRLIRTVIEAAHANGKWVGLCGELAGDPLAAPVLLGLGLDEWSMNPPAIAIVKERIRSLTISDCRPIAERCLGAASPEAVREILGGL